jgi:NAD(P)-dependent dehydrogenase (short-subunit alcohol dehydrogenase family)
VEPSGLALVTGASRGIGRAVALELGRRGFRVLGTVRSPAAGDALQAEARQIGISLRTEIFELTKVTELDLPDDLSVVINNAAAQECYFPVENVPIDAFRRLLEVNVIGQVAVLQQAIPILRARGEGVVCNITSTSILWPAPFFAPYRATKAAMSAICESLLLELGPFGIRVLEVLPGPVATEGLANSDRLDAENFAPYRDRARSMMDARPAIHAVAVSPEAVAQRIVSAVLSDDGAMRSACDPFADQMLAEWRATPDIARLEAARTQYEAGGGDLSPSGSH